MYMLSPSEPSFITSSPGLNLDNTRSSTIMAVCSSSSRFRKSFFWMALTIRLVSLLKWKNVVQFSQIISPWRWRVWPLTSGGHLSAVTTYETVFLILVCDISSVSWIGSEAMTAARLFLNSCTSLPLCPGNSETGKHRELILHWVSPFEACAITTSYPDHDIDFVAAAKASLFLEAVVLKETKTNIVTQSFLHLSFRDYSWIVFQ